MARPTSATRNFTITETSVTLASGQISRKVVGMATSAISSGTIAMNEAKTKARTSSAPQPGDQRLDGDARAAARAAVRRGGAQRVEAGDLDRRAGDGDAVERGLGRAGLGLAGVDAALGRDGDERERRAAVRGDEVRSWVDAYEAMRASGSAALTFARAASRSRATPGESTVVPAGSVTTGTSGATSPPLP